MSFGSRIGKWLRGIVWLDVVILLLFFAGTCAVYAHYVHMYLPRSWMMGMLGQGFMYGHTHFLLPPNPMLLTLDNPYEFNALRNQYRDMHDISYYNNHYYLYFGPVPALVIWIPVKYFLNVLLRDNDLCLIMGCTGVWFVYLLVYSVARIIRPKRDWLFYTGLLMGLLAAGSFSWILYLLRRPYFYEVAVIGAYCFSAMGLWCLWKYIRRPHAYGWAFLASLGFALSIGCRISHIFSGICLIVVLVYLAADRERRRRVLPYLIVTAIPMLCYFTAQGIYNYERFDSILETGWSYQLGIYDQHDPNFKRYVWETAPLHAYKYLLRLPTLSEDLTFPYFNVVPDWGVYPSPETEPVYGLLTTTPFVLFCFCFFIPALQRRFSGPLMVFSSCLMLYPTAMLSLLIVFFFSSQRYSLDFAAWYSLLAVFCFLQLLTCYEKRPAFYWILGLGIATIAIGLFNVSMLSTLGIAVPPSD